MTVVQ